MAKINLFNFLITSIDSDSDSDSYRIEFLCKVKLTDFGLTSFGFTLKQKSPKKCIFLGPNG